MPVSDLFARLQALGIRLELQGQELKIQAPKGSMTAGLQAELKLQKADLIRYLQAAETAESELSFANVSASDLVSSSKRYPLSPAQQRLWFLQQLEPQSARYHEAAAFTVSATLSTSQLDAVLKQLMQRHEILRTGFGFEQAKPYQDVSGSLVVPLTESAYSDSALRDFVLKPFVLEHAPLFRVGLFHKSAQTLLVLVFHHLITDFWSAGLALHEIASLWQGKELDPVPVQYGEYALMLETNVKQPDPTLKSFWQERLNKVPLQIDLMPSAIGHPLDSQMFRSGLVEVPLTNDQLALWEQQARVQKVTRFSYLLSAWQVFVCRWFGLEQAVIGFPTAGRHQREHEKVLGCFVNTILCPFEYEPTWRFTEYLQQQQAQLIELLQHSHLGFEHLVEIINPPRGMPYFPQLGIVMQDQWDQMPLQFDGQAAEWQELDFLPPKFELLLSFLGFRNSLRLQFDSQIQDAGVMQSLLTCFKDFFIGLLEQAGTPLEQIQLSDQVLSIPQVHSQSATTTQLLHQLVEIQAEKRPQAIASRWQGQSLTYAELNHKANQFARVLADKGIQVGDRIAIQATVSFDLIVALLGILKVGACYVPIDQDCPTERLLRLLQDAQTRLFIAESDLKVTSSGESLADGPPLTCPSLFLPDLIQETKTQNSSNLDLSLSADQLAYIIYTSGSTGQANGVCISHAQVTRLFSAMQSVFAHDSRDIGILFHSIAFDYSIWEIWGALAQGMSLVLLDRQDARDPDRTWQLIQSEKVSILNQTPSAFRYLSRAACRLGLAPALRALILSGEKLELAWLKEFMTHFGEQVQIFNSYGITETTVFVSWRNILLADLAQGHSVIGPALPDLSIHLLDHNLQPVPTGMVGEICVAGAGLSSGYWQRSELTAQRFVTTPQGRLYRSGDLARYLPNGELVYIGRRDLQIKLRGYRIETGEIQAALEALPDVQAAHVALKSSPQFQEPRLLAWVIPTGQALPSNWTISLMAALRQSLPTAMIPSEIISVTHFPLNQNGKLDSKALPDSADSVFLAEQSLPRASEAFSSLPEHSLEQQLRQILADLLQRSQIGLDDSFFDLGAHSLLMVEAREQIKNKLKIEVELVDLFHYPTLRQLAQHLRQSQYGWTVPQTQLSPATAQSSISADIAIIGISLRFPGADSPEQFWQNISTGTESILRLSPHELDQAGISPIEYQASDYVPALGWCSGIENFDAKFFGFSPREAEILDPQHRLILQLAWQVTEQAGYGNHQLSQSIGVFASSGLSRYLLFHLARQPLPMGLQPMQVLVANDKDFLATRIAHKLNLTGPALMVQSACSSSLAAVHFACESLRRGECQMALAGGVTLETRQQGYTWLEGGIYSQDGHCRPFDADATGIVGGSGGAWVLLKPLEQAQADGDTVYAVIKGSAINNDGANKAGYLAPSVTGQIEVIQRALQAAGVRPEQIGVVEAHGTGTAIGDPIEVKALQLAWNSLASDVLPSESCALGSLKGNLGHLDAAAGIAGLIKAALMLHYQAIVPSINIRKINPALNLEQSPFYLSQTLQDWQGPERHAAVSSLGMGGTNVHVILASAPVREPIQKNSDSEPVLFTLSAPDSQRFESLKQALLAFLANKKSELQLADFSKTLLTGRQSFDYRGFAVLDSLDQAAGQIASLQAHRVSHDSKTWVWLCPGLGSQSVAMGQAFWSLSPVYRQAIQECQTHLQDIWPYDAKTLLTDPDIIPETLKQPLLMQVLIFCHGYAMAHAYFALGLKPSLLLGHSFGEYLAVTLAGMVSLKEILPLIVLRAKLFGHLMESHPDGAVVSVIGSLEAVQPWLEQGISLASVNGTRLNGAGRLTLSASRELLHEFEEHSKLTCRWLDIPHVVHHPDLDGLLAELDQAAVHIQWRRPQTPVWSGLNNDLHTGDVPENYWSQQARQCLRFDLALAYLKQGKLVYQGLELGSGRHLSSLLQQQEITSFGGAMKTTTLWQLLGQLWQRGERLNWLTLDIKGRAVPLPGTLLSPQRHWIETGPLNQSAHELRPLAFAGWFQIPTWKRSWSPRQNQSAEWQSHDIELLLNSKASSWSANLVVSVPVFNDYQQALDYWLQCRQLILMLALQHWQGTLHLLCSAFSSVTGRVSDLPWASLLLGLVRTVPLEFPGIQLRLIERDKTSDIPEGEWQRHEPHVAWSQGYRWLPDWSSTDQLLGTARPEIELPTPIFKEQGVYLITGISGGLGQIFSQYLQSHYQATVLGISRHSVESDNCQESFVLDISDAQAVLQSIQDIQQKYGKLDGIIHTAGIPGHHLLAKLESEDLRETLAAKVQGSLNLHHALTELELQPDFVLLCSALASQLGAPGQSAYTAANAWLDHFAQQQGQPWISVNWGAWQGLGMAARALEQLPMPFKALYAQLLKWGINAELGTQALEHSLSLGQLLGTSQILASPLSLPALQDFQIKSWQQILKTSQPINIRSGAEQIAENTPDNPPQGETEELIARIWSQSLGVWPNRDQRFSELGGDSLMILQMKALLESQLHSDALQELPLAAFLQDLPLQELARVLEQSQHTGSHPVTDALPTKSIQENSLANPDLLVRLNRATQSPALYFVHAVSGTVFPFRHLAEQVPFALYGLQSQGLVGKSPHADIRSMADAYLQTLMNHGQAASFDGYWIGGWSFGGLVAYEMACQALEQGQAVKQLVLLDMQAPTPGHIMDLKDQAVRARFEADLDALGSVPGLDQMKQRLWQVFEANVQATLSFEPRRCEVPTLLLVAEDGFGKTHSEADLGWSNYLPNLTVVRIPGDHYSCLDTEHVREWFSYISNLT